MLAFRPFRLMTMSPKAKQPFTIEPLYYYRHTLPNPLRRPSTKQSSGSPPLSPLITLE